MPGPHPERESKFPQFLNAYTKHYSWTKNDLNFPDEKLSDEVNSSFSSFHSPSPSAHAHYRLELGPQSLSVGKEAFFLSILLGCCRLWYRAHAQSLEQYFSHMLGSEAPLGIANGLMWHAAGRVQHHRPPEAFYLHFLFRCFPLPPSLPFLIQYEWRIY